MTAPGAADGASRALVPDRAGAHAGRAGAAEGVAALVLGCLARAGHSLAAAESLTGGLLTAELTSVPGSSTVVRGAVVAYTTDLKTRLLGVDGSLLARVGPVDAAVAEAMAEGVRAHLGSTYGVATTGEAGPETGSGAPIGTVFVAVSGPDGQVCRALELVGERRRIREAAVDAALRLLADVVAPT